MKDPWGLVPPHIKANYDAEEMAERHFRSAGKLLMELRAFDENIVDIKFFGERAEDRYGIVPNRWHIHRRNTPPAPDSYIPIETPDGGYREPDSGVLNELRARDTRNRSVWEGILKKHAEKKPAALREKRFEDRGEAEEIAHAVRAGARVAGEGGMTRRRWAAK